MYIEGQKCPCCESGILKLVKGLEPYNIDHLMCSFCDGTFTLKDEQV